MWGSGELQRFYNITFRNAQPRKDKYSREQPWLKVAATSQGHTFCSTIGLHGTPRGTRLLLSTKISVPGARR